MYYPYKVVLNVYSSPDKYVSYEDFGRKEDLNNWAFTAKRILSQNLGITADFVKFVSYEHTMSVELVPLEIKEGWPVNLKTIPVFTYSFNNY